MKRFAMRAACIVSVVIPLAVLGGCGGGGTSAVTPIATATPRPIPTFTPAPRTLGKWQAALFKEASDSIPYQLYVPVTTANEKLPLVLFLHGAGQAGTDGVSQLHISQTHVFVLPRNQAKYPCFFLAPQAPQGNPGGDGTWSGLDWRTATSQQRTTPTVPMRLTLDLLRDLKNRFPAIDPSRIYITGVSMGGFGTWDAITREPQTFAAAIPVCGGGDPTTAARVASLPLWAWHDSKDPLIHVDRTRQMIAAMRAAGGQPIYTETTGYGHSEWLAAYGHTGLLEWLFSQKRS